MPSDVAQDATAQRGFRHLAGLVSGPGLDKSDRPGSQGELAETWTMVEAKRARKAETPKQPSRYLRSSAPYFYPDPEVRLFFLFF